MHVALSDSIINFSLQKWVSYYGSSGRFVLAARGAAFRSAPAPTVREKLKAARRRRAAPRGSRAKQNSAYCTYIYIYIRSISSDRRFDSLIVSTSLHNSRSLFKPTSPLSPRDARIISRRRWSAAACDTMISRSLADVRRYVDVTSRACCVAPRNRRPRKCERSRGV